MSVNKVKNSSSLLKKIGFPFFSLFIVIFLIQTLFFAACKKIEIDENAKLHFSTQELTFDTIFTTVGSITKRFIVYNKNAFPVKVDVRVANGVQSYFSINVDGVAGNHIKETEINANDSIFIHVKVTLNPNNQNTPFLITDSILFTTGKSIQQVNLLAYGQDAHFIVADSRVGNINYKIVAGAHETTHWTNEKPYVIYGWAAVDSLGKLIIEPGTKVYLHSGSGIWVYRYGNIEVNGTQEDPVLFRGDRLENWFDTDYAQWDRIWINESNQENIIQHAIITNAFIGIQIEALQEALYNNNYIHHTIIKNSAGSGLLSRASKVTVENSLITNNGVCGAQLEIGEYHFRHVTIANYFNQQNRKNPALYVSNSYTTSLFTYVGDAQCSFVNSIIYGSLENELVLKKENDNSLLFNTHFENCIIRSTQSNNDFVNCLINKNPMFVNTTELNFELNAQSPAIDAGKIGLRTTTDLLGNNRDLLPDIGAYEYMR